MSELHFHSVDYRRDSPKPTRLMNRGFWLNGIPRLLLLCRLSGHRPVIDGTKPFREGGPAYRWVCCDRCGTRPDPQGTLDSTVSEIGDQYAGPFDGSDAGDGLRNPGAWPSNPTWVFGGQAVVGRTFGGFSIEFKVGNSGSEHTLAAHISLSPVGALYLHTERFGTWLQRRLNPSGYHSRVIGLSVARGTLDWRLWAKRDSSSSDDLWWQRGSIKVGPRDQLLGVRRYWHTDESDIVTTAVRLPHGDDHDVHLKLQRREVGREKRPRKHDAWTVSWDGPSPGIPTKNGDRGRIYGLSVDVSERSVRNGTWPLEAAAHLAAKLTVMRASEGMGAIDDIDFDVEID